MSLFRRKNRRSFGNQGETEETVQLQTYAPYLSLAPREYLLPQTLADFEADFDRRAIRFLQQTTPDPYNGTYFDGLILPVQKEALDALALQRVDHVGAIAELIEKLWTGQRIKCDTKLAACQAELNEVEQELRHLTRIYHAGTALAEDEKEDPNEEI